jgi:hypothetical protein
MSTDGQIFVAFAVVWAALPTFKIITSLRSGVYLDKWGRWRRDEHPSEFWRGVFFMLLMALVPGFVWLLSALPVKA